MGTYDLSANEFQSGTSLRSASYAFNEMKSSGVELLVSVRKRTCGSGVKVCPPIGELLSSSGPVLWLPSFFL